MKRPHRVDASSVNGRKSGFLRKGIMKGLGGAVILLGILTGEEVNSVGMTMVKIPAGHFKMGQEKKLTDYKSRVTVDLDQSGDWDEKPVREVQMTRPFEISSTEVTNAQYEAFEPQHRATKMRDVSPKISKEDDAAVVNVSWEDAMRYCQWLSEKEKKHYRLPTEAEWEYACRAGTETFFHYGDLLPEKYQQINNDFYPHLELLVDEKCGLPYYDFVNKISLRIRKSPPNAWGLYEMHGNVQEWCLDWYAPYNEKETKDPVGTMGNTKVIRGGAFSRTARLLRSANRTSMIPFVRSVSTGFRVVRGSDIGELEKPLAPLPPIAPKPVKAWSDASYNPGKPLFEGPIEFVKIPPQSTGPLFSAHNHDPAIACMPNGDLLAVWYTCVQEVGTELAVLSSRLKVGSKEWTPAEPFFDAADVNDHAPALFVDGDTIYHFNKSWPGSYLRTSTDNGYTWTPFRPFCSLAQPGPNESNIKTQDGRILATLDGAIMESKDQGSTWTEITSKTQALQQLPGTQGKAIAGIHPGMVELKNGHLLALGRFDKAQLLMAYKDKLPQSLSEDGGRTWAYSISELPAVTSGQRLSLKRLKEGPILFCGFTDRLAKVNAEEVAKIGLNAFDGTLRTSKEGMILSDGKGGEIRGFGMYAAVSWDEGKTWPVRRLIAPETPPAQWMGTDGNPVNSTDSAHSEPLGYLAVAQDADGRINMISSRNYYRFNLEWLTQGTSHATPAK